MRASNFTCRMQAISRVWVDERMRLMLVVIVLLGLIDLALTWATMSAGGLHEGNALARWLIRYFPTSIALTGYKLLLTGIGVWSLWLGRKRGWVRHATVGCVIVYAWVIVQWVLYIQVVNQAFVMADTLPHPEATLVALR